MKIYSYVIPPPSTSATDLSAAPVFYHLNNLYFAASPAGSATCARFFGRKK